MLERANGPPHGAARECEMRLGERLEELGRQLGEREARHVDALAQARTRAEELRGSVADALARFVDAAHKSGAPHIQIDVSGVRLDDKHLHAFEFELSRGQHRAIVTVKSRAEVTLVGPFRTGKVEGPCRSFPLAASEEFDRSLIEFVSAFVEAAATP